MKTVKRTKQQIQAIKEAHEEQVYPLWDSWLENFKEFLDEEYSMKEVETFARSFHRKDIIEDKENNIKYRLVLNEKKIIELMGLEYKEQALDHREIKQLMIKHNLLTIEISPSTLIRRLFRKDFNVLGAKKNGTINIRKKG